jgi:hypothetical protein
MGQMKNAYKILVGKSEWMRPLWSLRHRWECNIKINLKDIVRCFKNFSALV